MEFNGMDKEQNSRMVLHKSLPPLPPALHRWGWLFCLQKERAFGNYSDSLVEKLESWDLLLFEMERKIKGHDKSRENNQCSL